MKNNLFLLLGLSFCLVGKAQEHECGTTLQSSYDSYRNQPELLKAVKQENEAFNKMLRDKCNQHLSNARLAAADSADKVVRYIPVVFHILHTEKDYNLSVEQIESQIETLNEDFRRLNASAADTPEPFKYTADSVAFTFSGSDINNLVGLDQYIILQAGPDNAEDFEFNIPSGDKFVIYFTNEDFQNAPVVEPTNGETITLHEIDITSLTTNEEVRDAVKAAIDDNFGTKVSTSIDSTITDPTLVVVNTDKGHAITKTFNIPSVYLGIDERQPGRYVASDARIEFRIAKIDPDGNPTNGINRIYSDRANMRDPSLEEGAVFPDTWRNSMKSVHQWDPTKYFNIWTVHKIPTGDGNILLGFAQFPYDLENKPETDGVVVADPYFGSTGTSTGLGRTLTHEAGHWLNLIHIWGDDDFRPDGTQIEDDDIQDGDLAILSSGTDEVHDTPSQGNRTPNTCPTFIEEGEMETLHGDMFMNYMDYSTDACMNLFTFGQVERMRAAMEVYRPEIWSEENLLATGISENFDASTLKPAVDFMIDRRFACTGKEIVFTNLSTNINGSSTYKWSFPGSNLADVTTKNTTIEFTEPGAYTVQLEVTNANGTTTKTMEDLIYVYSSSSEINTPLYANFTYYSSINGPNNIVTALSPDGENGWRHTTIGSPADDAEGGLCVASYQNDESEVQTLTFKTLNTNGLSSGAQLSFDYAYVKKQPDADDRIIISYRTGCSATWKTLYKNSTNPCLGNFVETEGMTTNGGQLMYLNFYPTANDWKTVGVDLPTAFIGKDEVYLRIEYFGRYGNFFYLDNFNISNAPLGQEEIVFENSIGVSPNPSNGNAVLQFNLNTASDVTIEIVDMVGKTHGSISNKYAEGQNKINIASIANQLSNGVYFAKITKNNRVFTQKFVVSKS